MNQNKKYGVMSVVFSVLLIVIIMVVNTGVDLLAGKYPLKADLTQNGIYKLSDYTKNMLHDLEKDVTVYAFYNKTDRNANILEILYRYQRESNKIHLNIVSPGENPALSLKYDETNSGLNSGTIIFDCDGKFTVVTTEEMSDYSSYLGYETEIYAEEKFSESILYVTSDIVKKVYIDEGHGGSDGYELNTVLSQYGYEKETIRLDKEITAEDVSVYMILGPVKDYTYQEIRYLDGYMKSGGKVFVAFDPSAQKLENLYGYLSEWGIEVKDEFVIEGDSSKSAFNTKLMFYATGLSHPISGDIFTNKYQVMIANTKPVYTNQVSGVVVREIMTTSKNGYTMSAESADSASAVMRGTVPIAATAEKDDARIAVYGSNLYFVDDLFGVGELANKELFLNSLEWLYSTKVNTGIRPKSIQGALLTISESQSALIITVVVAIPVLIIIFGIFVWIKRRHK